MSKMLTRLIKDERGLTFVMVSVGMMALVGMAALVTDFGLIALARQSLVNAADSAALAGARELTLDPNPATREVTARQKALEVAVANGAPSDRVTVGIDGGKLSVDAGQAVGLVMSRPFGVNSRDVHAHAAAAVGGVTSYRGIAPLCIKEQALTYGEICTLKYGSPTSPGNFGALSLGGRGADTYRQNLINGYNHEVRIGDVLETKPGNMSGPTDGIDQRLARCNDGCTYNNFRPGCPKILVVPTHNDDLKGRDEITVTGFAVIFVDRESTNSDSDEIKGYFVRMAAEGDIDTSRNVTGLYAVKLVE